MSATLYDRVGGQAGLQQLLRSFYADARQHAVLGPVFDAHVHDWPAHLAKIVEFWALQTGGPSAYRGGFGAAHLRPDIEPAHFSHWLWLWELNCHRALPPQEAAEMLALANDLAERLRRLVAVRGGVAVGAQPA